MYLAVVLLALGLISLVPLYSHADEFIRVASFNIAEFGEGTHPQTRDLDAIAAMLVNNQLDLIAVQEVGIKDQAENRLNALVGKMNSIASSGPKYFSYITPQTGDERYAFIYRSPVVIGEEDLWLDDDRGPNNPRAGGTIYYRIPIAVSFMAGDFDFYLVNVHLSWGNLDRRENEIADLREFLRAEGGAEKDWIVLGDMNRYGKYRVSDPKAFDQLLDESWNFLYRFPLLEAITSPDDMRESKAEKDE